MPKEALHRTLYVGTANEEKIIVDEYMGDDKKHETGQTVTADVSKRQRHSQSNLSLK